MLQRLLQSGARLAKPLMQDRRRHWLSDALHPRLLVTIPAPSTLSVHLHPPPEPLPARSAGDLPAAPPRSPACRVPANHHAACCCLQEAAAADDYGEFDVSSNVVSPVFRSTPWAGEQLKESSSPDAVRVLFVSESNVCRSVLADAIMTQLLEAHDMAGDLPC